MRKKLILTALTLAMLLSVCFAMTITASAASYTSGYYKYTVSGGNATITDVSSDLDGDVTIPSTLDGYTVTAIGQDSFRGNNNLTSIVIPDTVIAINPYAFKYCTGITSVIFGSNLDRINYGAFHGCTGLRSVIIPNSVTSISYNAFRDCTRLTSVKIGTGLTAIPNECFQGCNNLTTVNIGTNVTSIGFRAFRDCSALKNITWGSALKTIGADAFWGCSALTTVKIPDTVTSIGDYAFLGCSGINNLTLGKKLTSIGRCAFKSCTSLTHLIIPERVITIGTDAFINCSNITKVYIPLSLQTICLSAFKDSKKITDVYYEGTETDWSYISIQGNNAPITNAIADGRINYNYTLTDIADFTFVTYNRSATVIKTSGANIWTKAYSSGDSKLVRTAKFDSKVNVLGYATNETGSLWYKLSDGNWVYSTNVRLTDYNTADVENINKTFVVTSWGANVWSKPYSSGDSEVIRSEAKTAALKAVAQVRNSTGGLWYQLSGGGWIYSKNVNERIFDPADVIAYKRSATVIVPGVINIWGQPSTSAPSTLTRTAAYTTKLNVVAKYTTPAGGLWYQLTDGNWVYSANIRITDYNPADVQAINKTVTVTSWGANIWSKPYSSGDSSVVKTVAKAANLKVKGQVRNSTYGLWYQLADDSGWIYSNNVTVK